MRKRLDRTNLSRVVFSARNEPDGETIELVTEALSSESPYVRDAAAYGVGALGWTALRAPLERALAGEKNDQLSYSLRESLELIQRKVSRWTFLVECMVVDAMIDDPNDRFFDGLSANLQDLAKWGNRTGVDRSG